MERSCWWLVTRDESGKTFLVFGSNKGEEEARQKGLEMLSGLDFEIKRLPTSSLSRASSLLKGDKLERTRSLKEAGRRLGHSRSLRRSLRKRAVNGW